jgi:glycosyltransferase 2 family protein
MTARSHRTRRTLTLLAKIALATAILAYLVVEVQRHEGFVRLIHEPKRWQLLAAGLGCALTAVTLSFVRWHVLVTALGLQFPIIETLRLGALGFALNFVSLGSVGGDLFKAVFIAKEFPGRRTEAVATVLADRVMGLMMFMAIASGAILMADWSHASAAIKLLCHTILLTTAIGFGIIVLILLVPALSGDAVRRWLASVPLLGATAARLIGAVSAYRNQKRRLLLASGLCLVVAAMFLLSFFLVACGLPVHAPSLSEHLVVVPVAMMAGAIPATPNGLGTFEAAIEALYREVPGGSSVVPGDGTMVALAHRLTLMCVAVVGMIFYLCGRGNLTEVIHEVEEAAEVAETLA